MSFFLVKYGEATTIEFPMVKRNSVDLAQTANWTPAAADGAISKDGGNFTDLTNAAAIVGGSPTRGVSMFKVTLTAAELTCAEAVIQFVDASAKTVEDQSFLVYTWGHPSAKFKNDFMPEQAPRISRSTTQSFSTDTTAHAVSMPSSGSVEEGDLLIVVFINDGSATVTTPTGWVQQSSDANGSALRLSVYTKRCDGSENGTTVDFVTSAAEEAVSHILLVKKGNWYGAFFTDASTSRKAINIGTAATGTSTTPNPPSITLTWDKLNTLFIAVYGQVGNNTVTAYPANYVDSASANSGGADGVGMADAMRTGGVASEDPGTFTITSADWVAQTIAIRPAQPAADFGVYHANIEFTRDQANTKDEYTITWFKNGIRLTGGISSPTIQVIKRVDGTDLVASTAMTQIGSTGSYKYDESTNRVTLGEAVLVLVGATVDGITVTFSAVITRDSS